LPLPSGIVRMAEKFKTSHTAEAVTSRRTAKTVRDRPIVTMGSLYEVTTELLRGLISNPIRPVVSQNWGLTTPSQTCIVNCGQSIGRIVGFRYFLVNCTHRYCGVAILLEPVTQQSLLAKRSVLSVRVPRSQKLQMTA